jgi:hypothetical protein
MLGTVFESLVKINDEKGLETVASYLRDPDTSVRRKASKAYGTYLMGPANIR